MTFVKIIGLIAIMFLSALLGGYTLSVVWGWFIVPTFGLPILNIPSAIGIALVVGYMTKSYDNKKSEDDEIIGAIITAFIRPFMVLGIGWIVLQFM